jgi:hypothetical protein
MAICLSVPSADIGPKLIETMFSTGSILITAIAVLASLAFIMGGVYFVNKIFVKDTKEILVKFILLVFSALVGVYIVDKVVVFKIPLLSDNQDAELFDLIKTLTLMIFSYYFGTKKEKTDEGDR